VILPRPGYNLNLTEVRQELRRSFAYELRTGWLPPLNHAKGGHCWLSDETALRFFRGVRYHHHNAVDDARRRYEEHRSGEDPEWDDLVRLGYTRECAGRVWVTELGEHRARTGSMPALLELLDTRFRTNYTISDELRSDPELTDLIGAIDAGTATPFEIGLQSPAWVAARLWEAVPDPVSAGDFYELLWKYHDLYWPEITPSYVWSPENAQRFIDATLDTIERALPDDGWSLLRHEVVSRHPDLERSVPPLPATPIDRLAWLERLQFTHDQISEDSQVTALVGLLICQLFATQHVPVPVALAERLFGLALGRPVILWLLRSWSHARPILLADLVVEPRLCAFACALIGEFPTPHRAMTLSFDAAGANDGDRENAFADAVTVLAALFATDQVAAADVASLIVWAFREHGNAFSERRASVLRRLRRFIEETPSGHVQQLVTELQRDLDFRLGTPIYAAALEIISASSDDNAGDGSALLGGYVDALRRADYSLSAKFVSANGAAGLMRFALRDATTAVLGVPAGLFTLERSDDPNPNEFSENDRLARAIRAHVRVLARSLVDLDADGQARVADALAASIEFGSRDRAHGGVVSAFAGRYEQWPNRTDDRPIGEDLAVALDACTGAQRARLLNAIAQIDEPYTLAKLLKVISPELRQQITEMIRGLPPERAAGTWSLTETQQRINALLDAELPDMAQFYADSELKLQTLGAVPHREFERFVRRLRLALLNGDWESLYGASVPESVGHDRQFADENLALYRGIAQLRDPNGSPEAAEQIFANLAWRYPHVQAYAVNTLVARVRQLFKDDVFAFLPDEAVTKAQTALQEAERAEASQAVGVGDRDLIDGYRGLILLGLRRPGAALEVLATRVVSTTNPFVGAVVAVAQHRLGQSATARHTLGAAIEQLGEAPILLAARAVVANEEPRAVRIEPEKPQPPADRIRNLRENFFDLQRRDPEQQARVLVDSEELSELATVVVRDASNAFVELVPALRARPGEDQYNALLHQLIRARSLLLGWVVSQEPPHGWSARENYGFPDILVSRDTAVYVVIEGVVVDTRAHTKTAEDALREHFVKLFGYAECGVLMHVTYAEVEDVAGIIEVLKSIAGQPPVGFDVARESADLPPSGSSCTGFTAYYRTPERPIAVIFLVLNLSQERARNAARTAATVSQTVRGA